jgi:YVTN family beta-propeller protein
LLLTSCTKDKGLTIYGNYPNEIGKIFLNKCATAGCHNTASAGAASGLNLSSWNDLFNGSKSGSPVIPFRSDFSSLCYFINTYADLGPINIPTMPLNKDPLTREEVSAIKNWIDDGAPDVNGKIKWTDNPLRKKIYVTNQGCDVVTVIDAATQLPMRYITVGQDPNSIEVPHMVKVSPDGQYWYVVFVATNILQKFRCSDDVLIGQVDLGAYINWNTLIITDDGKKAFCVSWSSSAAITSVDLEKMQKINTVSGPSITNIHGVALNAANDELYVTAQTGNYICKLDTALTTVQQISLENSLPVNYTSSLDPHEILISPNKQKFYITCQKTNEIRVFDIAAQSVSNVITVGDYPQEMVASAVQNKLYVSCPEDKTSFPGTHGSVSVMDLSNFSVQKIKVDALPHGIGVDESKNALFVASRNILSTGPTPHHSSACGGRNGFLTYINLTTLEISNKKTELSVDPYSISVRK